MNALDNEDDRRGFARWLRQQAEARQWRQRELASACGVSQQTASRWLSGQSAPAGIHLRSLAVALDITTDELLEIMGHIPEEPKGPQ
ncbi:MAG TPA: helix-turn-helix transcriptional regulator [Acidimicrobiales bacterium]|nr:helix-turn-helix transcriptional regulator [Acidimicrobiales bacterium]